ncbi:MAG TPA: DUF6174 domain-containing protein [Gemmatimonadales bacterium]|nr:DUF6174 domain-containing protein [Gemmatimonadales bacterium]
MMSRFRMPWATLVGLSLLVGCSDPFGSGEERELERAQARWSAAGLQDYQVDVRLGCFCQASLPVFTRLTVQAGQVVAADPLTPTPGAEGIPPEAWPTVPGVFGLIESASHQSDYTEIEAQYDATLGYPTRVKLRCEEDVLDCGALYELQNLTPGTGGS